MCAVVLCVCFVCVLRVCASCVCFVCVCFVCACLGGVCFMCVCMLSVCTMDTGVARRPNPLITHPPNKRDRLSTTSPPHLHHPHPPSSGRRSGQQQRRAAGRTLAQGGAADGGQRKGQPRPRDALLRLSANGERETRGDARRSTFFSAGAHGRMSCVLIVVSVLHLTAAPLSPGPGSALSSPVPFYTSYAPTLPPCLYSHRLLQSSPHSLQRHPFNAISCTLIVGFVLHLTHSAASPLRP